MKLYLHATTKPTCPECGSSVKKHGPTCAVVSVCFYQHGKRRLAFYRCGMCYWRVPESHTGEPVNITEVVADRLPEMFPTTDLRRLWTGAPFPEHGVATDRDYMEARHRRQAKWTLMCIAQQEDRAKPAKLVIRLLIPGYVPVDLEMLVPNTTDSLIERTVHALLRSDRGDASTTLERTSKGWIAWDEEDELVAVIKLAP